LIFVINSGWKCFIVKKPSPSGQNRQKNSLKECVYVNSAQNTVPYCQKYTLQPAFSAGDFAHWTMQLNFTKMSLGIQAWSSLAVNSLSNQSTQRSLERWYWWTINSGTDNH